MRSRTRSSSSSPKERHALSLKSRIDVLQTTPAVVNMEIGALEEEARDRIERFRDLLDRNPQEARKAMDAPLDGPLMFTPVDLPDGKRYRVEGPVAIGNLFATEHASEMKADSGLKLKATPTGFEPVLPA